MADLRQLKIKTGVVSRLGKEVKTYQQEETAQTAKVNQARESKEDVSRPQACLTETQAALQQCLTKFQEAFQELQAMVQTGGFAGTEELNKAQEVLQTYAQLAA